MTAIRTPASLWNGFDVTGPNDRHIPLRQVGPTQFHLGRCKITYTGKTGLEKYVERGDLEPELHEQIRSIDETLLPQTDLASVPGPLRWFTNTYGPHTPAALIHDYLIPDKGTAPIVPEEYADRYFRYMLGSVGVPRFKRYIMWAAVALRTRLKSRKQGRPAMLAAWALTAVVGVLALFTSAGSLWFGDGSVLGINASTVLVLSLVAPFVVSLLWGRQYGAGIVAALAAPWIVPATLVAALGYSVYWVLERLSNLIDDIIRPKRLV